jgi:hypothetical protein
MAEAEIDLRGDPMTIAKIWELLNTICGMERTVVKNAAHEARVRKARGE